MTGVFDVDGFALVDLALGAGDAVRACVTVDDALSIRMTGLLTGNFEMGLRMDGPEVFIAELLANGPLIE